MLFIKIEERINSKDCIEYLEKKGYKPVKKLDLNVDEIVLAIDTESKTFILVEEGEYVEKNVLSYEREYDIINNFVSGIVYHYHCICFLGTCGIDIKSDGTIEVEQRFFKKCKIEVEHKEELVKGVVSIIKTFKKSKKKENNQQENYIMITDAASNSYFFIDGEGGYHFYDDRDCYDDLNENDFNKVHRKILKYLKDKYSLRLDV